MSGKCQWFYCNGFHIVMFKMSEIVDINTAYYQNDGLVTETANNWWTPFHLILFVFCRKQLLGFQRSSH